FYEAQLLDPRRARELQRDILELVKANHIDRELQLEGQMDDAALWLPRLDTYLCDLKESQIRDGLHVFGQSPEGRLRSDTLLALVRVERGDGKGGNASLIRTLAKALALSFDPLDCDLGQPWQGPRPAILEALAPPPWRTCGDTRERLELLALALIEQGLDGCLQLPDEAPWQPVRSVLQ